MQSTNKLLDDIAGIALKVLGQVEKAQTKCGTLNFPENLCDSIFSFSDLKKRIQTLEEDVCTMKKKLEEMHANNYRSHPSDMNEK